MLIKIKIFYARRFAETDYLRPLLHAVLTDLRTSTVQLEINKIYFLVNFVQNFLVYSTNLIEIFQKSLILS